MINPLAKHAINSVKRKWWQSLILIVTIAFSIALLNFMYECVTTIKEEEAVRNRQSIGNSDIIIEYSGEEFGGVISANGLKKHLGQDDFVSGFYSLLLNSDDKINIMSAAADFYSIDKMFDFEFIRYGKITTGSINSSLLVSRNFAEENGLEIGDKYNLYVFGNKKEFVVQGISKTPFMAEYDLLINIDGLLGILASQSPIFTGFDKDNLPYSTIYIKLAQPQTKEAVYDRLNSLELENCEVSLSNADKSNGLAAQIFRIILFIMQFLISVLSVILIYSILCIIVDYRKNDEKALILAGTPDKKITIALAVELLIYTVIGWLAGLTLSRIFIAVSDSWIVFDYARLNQSAEGVFFGLAVEIGIVLFALILHNLRLRNISGKSYSKVSVIIIAVVAAAIIISSLLFLCIPPEKFVYIAVSGVILTLLLMAVGVPRLVKKICGAINKSSALQKAPACFAYAVKNTVKVKALHSFCGVLSMVITIAVCLGVIFNYGTRQAKTDLFDCDYVIINNSPQLQQAITDLDGTQDSCRLMFSTKARFNNGRMLNLISVDSKDFLNSAIDVDKLPAGNEIVLPRSLGILYGLEVGDSIDVNLDNKKITFVISEFLDKIDFVGLVDSTYLGYGQNYLLVRSDGSAQDYFEQLNTLANGNFAVVGDVRLIVDMFQQRVKLFIICAAVFFILSLVISLTGMINNLCVSYNNRRQEFYYYTLAGMQKSDIGKMIACELLTVVVFAIIISAAGSGYLVSMMNKALNSFGYMLY